LFFVKPNRPIIVSDVKTAAPAVDGFEGFEQVASYRLYGLDGVRKVASGEWIDADDDRAAIEAAKMRFERGDCEVWQGRRLVARLDGHGGRCR
jgi:hypothetical protein